MAKAKASPRTADKTARSSAKRSSTPKLTPRRRRAAAVPPAPSITDPADTQTVPTQSYPQPKSRKPADKSPSPALPPCALHASWIPEETGGQLRIWAEIVSKTKRPRKGQHPYQLRRPELGSLLQTFWPLLAIEIPDAKQNIETWIVLPGDGTRPTPSLELQADLEDETNESTGWTAWRVDTFECANPLPLLAPRNTTETTEAVRIAQDFEFWQNLLHRLVLAVRRHEYLPSIQAREVPKKGRSKRSGKSAFQFEAGWELARHVEDDLVATYSRAIPGVCRAMWHDDPADVNGKPSLHDPEAIIRHFLAVNLQRLVISSKMTKAIAKRIENTVIASAIGTSQEPSSYSLPESDSLNEKTWDQWFRWRNRIQRSASESDERICFRLAEANRESPEIWRLEWLLSSRNDPSLLIPLANYWQSRLSEEPSPRSIREVLLQLGQAARIYNKLWTGMNSTAPSEVVLEREEALEFLRNQAPVLQGAGFRVIVPAWWTITGQRRLRVKLTARNNRADGSQGTESSGLFGFDSVVEFNAQVIFDGKPVTPEEWQRLVQAKEGLVEVRGEWMELQSDELARLEEFWQSAGETQTMTVADLLRAEADPTSSGIEVDYEGELRSMLDGLRNSDSLEVLDQPDGFAGQLREYQIRGFSWISYLERLGLGACLADDMGLGKTIQILAAILDDKLKNPKSGPTLLLAPTSVLGNWKHEATRFTPQLSARIHHGPDRPKETEPFKETIQNADLVIVSFGVARKDEALLRGIPWHRIVVDECQNLKNPKAAVTKAVRHFKARRRIALTGTPVENRLMDLWSLFSVINPGYLGNMTDFRKNLEIPIMRHDDRAAKRRLRGMVQPFILRRMKTDKAIIRDLPDKLEQNSLCNLTPEQATLYQAVVSKINEALADSEKSARQGLMLSALMRLKQICNHPAQFLQDGSEFSETRSHKLSRVCEMLDEIEAENESVLVFTQFAELGKSLEALFRRRYRGAVYYLHGGTSISRREHMVKEFQDPETKRAIFLLSLRAGGTGITLTRANHVIHFDRWWNPAVENQATDRAYRIGQEKKVFVHKMVTMGTLEERIDELINSKKQLADEIVGSDESWLANLDNETFQNLISLDRDSAVID